MTVFPFCYCLRYSKCLTLNKSNYTRLSEIVGKNHGPSIENICVITRLLATSPKIFSQKKLEKPGFKVTKVITEEGVKEVKKKRYIPRITLYNTDGSINVITFEDAEKLAKRRNLKLFKVADTDSKSDRATYKLVMPGTTTKPKIKETLGKVEEKEMHIKSKIEHNDLQSKAKNITKWIEKGMHVRVVLSSEGGNINQAEKVYNSIERIISEHGRIVQKITKGSDIRFQILPPKKVKSSTEKTIKEDSEEKINNEIDA